jgi:hypothetical protein
MLGAAGAMIGNARKIANLVRRLSSPSDGEVVATARALLRTLKATGADIHTLADRIEKPNGKSFISEEKMRQVWNAGYAAGVRATENRQHGVDDFVGTDGKPTWEGVALFLQRNKHRLDPKHHAFIDDMAARTVWGHEPSEKQHKYLHSLFYKLGGKIT